MVSGPLRDASVVFCAKRSGAEGEHLTVLSAGSPFLDPATWLAVRRTCPEVLWPFVSCDLTFAWASGSVARYGRAFDPIGYLPSTRIVAIVTPRGQGMLDFNFGRY
jgi:hypothetical protein